jgi:aminoglycoside phosphotransferase (APT) family kinase protein
MLWEAAQDGRLAFAVAPPDRYDAALHTLSQHAIVGEPLRSRLLSPEGLALGEPLGRALASLTTSGLRPAAAPDAWTPLTRVRAAGADLARRVPALEPMVADVLRRIEALDRAVGARPARPMHGAPHPPQWLQAGDRLGLVDFDRFALGDPELDVAVLLAELEDESRAPEGLGAAVLAGYEAAAGPLEGRLLVAYRAAGRLAAARRFARAVRPDGPRRAERPLRAAIAVLDEAGA